MNEQKKKWPWFVAGTILIVLAAGAAFGITYFAGKERSKRQDEYFQRLHELSTDATTMEPPPTELPENATDEQFEEKLKEIEERSNREMDRINERSDRLSRAMDEGYDPGPKYNLWMAALFIVFGVGAGYCFKKGGH